MSYKGILTCIVGGGVKEALFLRPGLGAVPPLQLPIEQS